VVGNSQDGLTAMRLARAMPSRLVALGLAGLGASVCSHPWVF